MIAITIGACLVLTMLAWLCVNFGYSTRRDQFVIKRIREYAMKNKDEKEYDKIFKDQYNPCGKKPLSYIIGYYFILFVFLNIVILGIYVMSILLTNSAILKMLIVLNFVANLFFFIIYYDKYIRINKNNQS